METWSITFPSNKSHDQRGPTGQKHSYLLSSRSMTTLRQLFSQFSLFDWPEGCLAGRARSGAANLERCSRDLWRTRVTYKDGGGGQHENIKCGFLWAGTNAAQHKAGFMPLGDCKRGTDLRSAVPQLLSSAAASCFLSSSTSPPGDNRWVRGDVLQPSLVSNIVGTNPSRSCWCPPEEAPLFSSSSSLQRSSSAVWITHTQTVRNTTQSAHTGVQLKETYVC